MIQAEIYLHFKEESRHLESILVTRDEFDQLQKELHEIMAPENDPEEILSPFGEVAHILLSTNLGKTLIIPGP